MLQTFRDRVPAARSRNLSLEPSNSAQLSVLPLSSPAELQYTDLAPHSQRAPLQVARVRITGQILGFLVFT
jgi:hypothetical protein